MLRTTSKLALLTAAMLIPVNAFSADDDLKPATGAAAADDPMPSAAMNDGEVAGFIQVLNEVIQQDAQLATTKGTGTQVKDFANLLLEEHQKLGKASSGLTSRQGIMPTESIQSLLLRAGGVRNQLILQSASGDAFDKAFIDQQVELHQTLVDMLDRQLLLGLKDASFKAFMQQLRPLEMMHLERAKAIQEDLSKRSTPA